MQEWLSWARGPLFWAALAFMVLGLLRELALVAWELARVRRLAGDKNLPVRKVAATTAGWLFPARRLLRRWPYSVTTMVFHVAVILVPLFLAGHIALWDRAIGLSWPALPNAVATALTVAVVLAALAVIIQRATIRAARALGRFQDYALPVMIGVTFVTGFMTMHPAWNPFAFQPVFLAHVLAGDLLFLLVPLSKLSHMLLLPLAQLVSEAAWHWPPDAGTRVAAALGKEGEPI